jgi:predicted RNase H-like HicB family nuclease
MAKKRIKATIERTRTGFSAYAEGLPVITTGKTISQLKKNMQEALNFYFEEEKSAVIPGSITFDFDLKQFFQYYRVINAKFLADRIGMNPTLLSQYVQGRKKPSLEQTERILAGLQEIGKELAQIRLTTE